MPWNFILSSSSVQQTSKLQASFYDKSTSIQTKGRPIKTGLCAQHRHTPFAGACFLYLGRSLPVCTLLNERFRFYYRNAKVIKSLEREIGRASCRERVETWGGGGAGKTKSGRRTQRRCGTSEGTITSAAACDWG